MIVLADCWKSEDNGVHFVIKVPLYLLYKIYHISFNNLVDRQRKETYSTIR